ncbi:MAG: AAA family ATPase [Armatimonadetes bacterium]|nr:AAA family ATPase [Armatimonadota bacterium]
MSIPDLALAQEFARQARAIRCESDEFELLSFDQLEAEPDPVYVVDGLLKEGDLVVIYGMPKAGKSFIATDLLASCTRPGNKFAGQFLVHEAVPSIYATGEGRGGLKFRSMELKVQHNLTPEERDLIRWCKSVPNLIAGNDDPRSLPKFLNSISRRLTRDGLGIIVLDTLRLCTVGADENQTRDMGIVMNVLLNSIRETFPRAITVVIHHSNKGGTMGGSLQIAGSADLILKVTKKGNDHQFECEDAKDIPGFAPIAFQLMPGVSSALVDWQGQRVLKINTRDLKRNAVLDYLRNYCQGEESAKSITQIAASMEGVSRDTVGNYVRAAKSDPTSGITSSQIRCKDANKIVEKWWSEGF